MAKTFAFITSMFSNNFSRILMLSIKKKLDSLGIDLITFTGTSLKEHCVKWVDDSTNTIYEIISGDKFDGLIIYGGTLGQLITNEEMSEFCKKYKTPIVNISSEIPGVPSVIVSNYEGMYELVNHLINAHNYKHIGFIKGPDGHSEAEDRLLGYKQALIDNGYEVNNDYIYKGNFSPQAGVDAVKDYLAQDVFKLDVFVCVDDDTAFGVLDELHRQNIRVPDDIALVGFDDAEASGNINPPLTTVNQPFNELGEAAVDILIDLISGLEVDDVTYIPSKAVIRDSCGCLKSLRTYFPKSYNDISEDSIKNSSEEELVEIILDHYRELHNLTYSRIYSFLESLFKAVETGEENDLYRSFNKIIESIDHRKIGLLNEFLDYCSNILQLRSGKNIESQLFLEKIKLRSSVNIIHDKAIEKIESRDKYFQLNDINQNLHGALSIEGLLNDIYATLPPVGIKGLFIVSSDNNKNISEYVKLIYGYTLDGIIDVNKYREPFLSKFILPENLLEQSKTSWLVMTLSFNDEVFGYLVLDVDDEATELTHAISWHFGSSLKRISILEEKNRKARELEDAMETLRETQEQLIESEKLSSLGAMVAGVAHEINTPLGVVVTSVSYIDDLTRELLKVYNDNKLSKSRMEFYFKNIEEVINTTMNSAKRAAALVNSFKKVAVDQASEERRVINLKEYILETVLTLKPKFKNKNVDFKVNCNQKIEINSYPGAISQLITNLVSNSLVHGFPGKMKGKIILDILSRDNIISMIFHDSGVGIKEENIKKIFEPFYTTVRDTGGSGLGLHIVHNLITQVLKGSIKVSSSINVGTTFVIDFPKSL